MLAIDPQAVKRTVVGGLPSGRGRLDGRAVSADHSARRGFALQPGWRRGDPRGHGTLDDPSFRHPASYLRDLDAFAPWIVARVFQWPERVTGRWLGPAEAPLTGIAGTATVSPQIKLTQNRGMSLWRSHAAKWSLWPFSSHS